MSAVTVAVALAAVGVGGLLTSRVVRRRARVPRRVAGGNASSRRTGCYARRCCCSLALPARVHRYVDIAVAVCSRVIAIVIVIKRRHRPLPGTGGGESGGGGYRRPLPAVRSS